MERPGRPDRDKQLKSKIEALIKKGRSEIKKHIAPLLSGARTRETTGQAANEQDASQPGINWNQVTVACRWPHLRYYWDLFSDHPAYGIGESLEVGYASDAEIIASPAVSDIPDTEKYRPTSHSHTEEERGQSVPLSDSSSSSTSSPKSSGDTSDEEGRPLSSTKKRRKHVRSASRPKRKCLEQVESKGPAAVGSRRPDQEKINPA